jgi:hypothetical protein
MVIATEPCSCLRPTALVGSEFLFRRHTMWVEH